MHLALAFTSPWQIQRGSGEARRATLARADGTPELAVSFGPIILQPDEPRRWIEHVLHQELPPKSKLVVGKTYEHATACGWPVRIVEAEVVDLDARVLEVRVCAFFQFMEHAATATVRAIDRATFERASRSVLAILESGRPDWRGEPTCLVEFWDLETAAPVAASAVTPRPAREGLDPAAIEGALAQLGTPTTASDHVRRGTLLLDLDRVDEALDAFAAAIALEPTLAIAHYYRGIALGTRGRHADAVVAWEHSLELAPDRIDTLYNLAQARYLVGDFPGALAAFEAVVRLDPADVMVQRKVIQCLYALDRYADGELARAAFRSAWLASAEPRVRQVSEYVFDQLEVDGAPVHVIETLRPANLGAYPMLQFRMVRRHEGREQTIATVAVETGDYARAAGTPFVLTVTAGSRYRVIGTLANLPAYPQLEQDAIRLLREVATSAPG